MNTTLEKVVVPRRMWRKFVAGYLSVLTTSPE
jgi:hypothetical protein